MPVLYLKTDFYSYFARHSIIGCLRRKCQANSINIRIVPFQSLSRVDDTAAKFTLIRKGSMPYSMPMMLPRLVCLACARNFVQSTPIIPTFRCSSSLLARPQQRQASILAQLSDNPAAYHKEKRVGRGPASGKGKTSGRGHKGQKQHGKVPRGFEGGQTPIEVVHGKRGFKNVYALPLYYRILHD